jgi:mannose-6-phosphate isomerase-like protein (cupin superfamily)
VKAFEYDEITRLREASGDSYLQFVNERSLSLGLYVLPAESIDTQLPHDEDEIYYVIEGREVIDVAGERRQVQPGSVVFVARHVEHRFVEIEADLSILVFFAPEHTR